MKDLSVQFKCHSLHSTPDEPAVTHICTPNDWLHFVFAWENALVCFAYIQKHVGIRAMAAIAARAAAVASNRTNFSLFYVKLYDFPLSWDGWHLTRQLTSRHQPKISTRKYEWNWFTMCNGFSGIYCCEWVNLSMPSKWNIFRWKFSRDSFKVFSRVFFWVLPLLLLLLLAALTPTELVAENGVYDR